MTKYIYLFLALAAAGTAVWYIAFYESTTPGANYQNTYAGIGICAAIIFGGLFLSGFSIRRRLKPHHLLK
jgi:hypothetical protein